MQKSDGWSVTRGQNGGLRQTVETGGGLAEAAVGEVRGLPFPRVVPASLPCDTVLAGQHLVEALHPCSLDPTKLVDRAPPGSGLSEPHVVHFPDNLETRIRIECKPRLVKEPVRTGTSGLASGV